MTLKLDEFVCLMLVTLANNSKNYDELGNKLVYLPANYKQNIENILCEDNGWKEEFSVLIDTDKYFENHFKWEIELSKNIKELLTILKKEVDYDFRSDCILIPFNKKEIDFVMNEFKNEEVKDRMDHFTNLLIDRIYSREFQENNYDYSAKAVKKMSELNDSSRGIKKKALKFFR